VGDDVARGDDAMTCKRTLRDFANLPIDTICECGHASAVHGINGCVLCPLEDRIKALEERP
jgi:hypothetical protein